MNGRFFSGTKVVAYIATGAEKFKKSKEEEDAYVEGVRAENDGPVA